MSRGAVIFGAIVGSIVSVIGGYAIGMSEAQRHVTYVPDTNYKLRCVGSFPGPPDPVTNLQSECGWEKR